MVAAASEVGELVCKANRGIHTPLAPDAKTARAIFLAVESSIPRAHDKPHYPDVKVVDSADHWTVFRSGEPDSKPDSGVIVITFGGALEMEIDKCNGAILRAHCSR
jgi:hypothetical protein